MFNIQHQITLADGSTFSLYGKDYFGDKRVFWQAHQDTLKELVAQARAVGPPIAVTYPPKEHVYTYEEIEDFLEWLKSEHPVEL